MSILDDDAITERKIAVSNKLSTFNTVDPDTPAENIVFKMVTDGEGSRGAYVLTAAGSYEKLLQASEAGGWTYVILGSDETSTSTSNVDTALAFTPEADSFYEVEGKLFLKSVATTTGVRPGINWPNTGITQNVGWVVSPNSATAFASRFWGNTTTANAAATGVPVANEGLYGELKAMFLTNGSIAGDFAVTIATEVAASQVTIAANSFIRYRKVT